MAARSGKGQGTVRDTYYGAFKAVLSRLGPGESIEIHELFESAALPQSSFATRKKYLRGFIDANREILDQVSGLYPSVETVLQLVEDRAGRIREKNLDQANVHCRQIIQRIGRPIVEKFVRDSLSKHMKADHVALEITDLMSFLLEEYADFVRSSGNGLVSIAGSINEALLVKAMENGGMKSGTHFTKTGTRGEADIRIHSTARARAQLGVEVKSYRARERLLRGLRDIDGLKVAAGFFRDAKEFNDSRTVALLDAGAAAVYLPKSTLSQISGAARARISQQVIADRSRFYRPLDRFVSDMKHFSHLGSLPKY